MGLSGIIKRRNSESKGNVPIGKFLYLVVFFTVLYFIGKTGYLFVQHIFFPKEPVRIPSNVSFTISKFKFIDGRIVVPVHIGGDPVCYNFMIDTGANVSCVSKKLSLKHGKHPVKGTVSDYYGHGKIVEFMSVEDVTALGLEIDEMRVVVDETLLGSGLDGVLGITLLDKFIVELNFQNLFIAITENEFNFPNVEETSYFSCIIKDNRMLYIPCTLNGKVSDRFLFDTGCYDGITLREFIVDSHFRDIAVIPREGDYHGVVEWKKHKKAPLELSTFEMGNFKLDKPKLYVTDTYHSVLGTAYARNFNIRIRFKDKQIAFLNFREVDGYYNPADFEKPVVITD